MFRTLHLLSYSCTAVAPQKIEGLPVWKFSLRQEFLWFLPVLEKNRLKLANFLGQVHDYGTSSAAKSVWYLVETRNVFWLGAWLPTDPWLVTSVKQLELGFDKISILCLTSTIFSLSMIDSTCVGSVCGSDGSTISPSFFVPLFSLTFTFSKRRILRISVLIVGSFPISFSSNKCKRRFFLRFRCLFGFESGTAGCSFLVSNRLFLSRCSANRSNVLFVQKILNLKLDKCRWKSVRWSPIAYFFVEHSQPGGASPPTARSPQGILYFSEIRWVRSVLDPIKK